jgi:hypothetical protein
MDHVVGAAGDLDVIDMGAVTDDEFESGVDLVASRRLVAFDEHDARARLDHDQRAREHGGRLRSRGEHQMDRVLDGGILGHVDQRAVTHQRHIERDDAFAIGWDHFA